MFDTPCVSTPRRSVIVSTSAPSAASSLLSPSFSKIWVTVRRSAASDTRTWSFAGTLKRSRIIVPSRIWAARPVALRGVHPSPFSRGRLAVPGRLGAAMPVPDFLYGTAWKEERTPALTELALGAGFRGIDTANQRRHYFEAGVGKALVAAYRAGLVTRDDLFLQTKFTYQGGQDHRLPYDPRADLSTQVAQSMTSSLEHLGTDYVDSYVLHGPSSGRDWTEDDAEVWTAMVKERAAGRARVRPEPLLRASGLGPRRPRLLPGAANRLPGVLAPHREPRGAAPSAGRPHRGPRGRHADADRVSLRARGRHASPDRYLQRRAHAPGPGEPRPVTLRRRGGGDRVAGRIEARSGPDPRSPSRSQLSLPVARRSPGVARVRDGDGHPGLVHHGPDRLGAPAHHVRLAAAPRHARLADVRCAGRPARIPGDAFHDARDLRGAGRARPAARADRHADARVGARHRRAGRSRPSQRSGHAQRAHRRDDSAAAPDERRRPLPRHHGLGARLRRARGRGALDGARSRTHLRTGHDALRREPRVDLRRGAAARHSRSGRYKARGFDGRGRQPLTRPRSPRRASLRAAPAGAARDDVAGIPGQPDGLSDIERPPALRGAQHLPGRRDGTGMARGQLRGGEPRGLDHHRLDRRTTAPRARDADLHGTLVPGAAGLRQLEEHEHGA